MRRSVCQKHRVVGRAREQGFSLLEVLVAFTVLAAAAALLLEGFSGGLRSVQTADRYTHAVLHAESILSELSVVPHEHLGERTGVLPGGFSWSSHVGFYESEPSRLQELTITAYELTVVVRWLDVSTPRQVEIGTVALGPWPE